MWILGIFLFLAVALISWAWVQGIDYMNENHPDYKGEDFLNCDKNEDNETDIHNVGLGNFKRWHGENCKHKNND